MNMMMTSLPLLPFYMTQDDDDGVGLMMMAMIMRTILMIMMVMVMIMIIMVWMMMTMIIFGIKMMRKMRLVTIHTYPETCVYRSQKSYGSSMFRCSYFHTLRQIICCAT